MTEQTSALKSKENNNVASKQPKPPMQKAAPGTTKRIFGYIFQYKWRVALVVVCILVGAAAQAGSSLFLQSLIDTYILPMVGATNPDWMPLLRALTLMACLYAAGIFCSWLWQWIIVAASREHRVRVFALADVLGLAPEMERGAVAELPHASAAVVSPASIAGRSALAPTP